MDSFNLAQGRKKILIEHDLSDKISDEVLDYRLLNIKINGHHKNKTEVTVRGEYELFIISAELVNNKLMYKTFRKKENFKEKFNLEMIKHLVNVNKKGLELQEFPEVYTTIAEVGLSQIIKPDSLVLKDAEPKIGIEVEIVTGQIMGQPVPQESPKTVIDDNQEIGDCLDKDFMKRFQELFPIRQGSAGSYMVLYQDGKNYVFGQGNEKMRD